MKILIFGEVSSSAGLSILVQGALAKNIQCGFRNPGRVIASEVESCDAIVVENSMAGLNDHVCTVYGALAKSPAILVFETASDIPGSFVISLDDSAAGDENTWTAAEIATGKPWETLAPQIAGLATVAARGGTSETENALRGRLAKASRLIGELRGKIETMEVAAQQAVRDFSEECEARKSTLCLLEASRNELAAEKESLEVVRSDLAAMTEAFEPLNAAQMARDQKEVSGMLSEISGKKETPAAFDPTKRKRGRPTKAEAEARDAAEQANNA